MLCQHDISSSFLMNCESQIYIPDWPRSALRMALMPYWSLGGRDDINKPALLVPRQLYGGMLYSLLWWEPHAFGCFHLQRASNWQELWCFHCFKQNNFLNKESVCQRSGSQIGFVINNMLGYGYRDICCHERQNLLVFYLSTTIKYSLDVKDIANNK